MNVEVRAEYVCGHASRVVCAGNFPPSQLTAGLSRMVAEADEGGEVRFVCPCGRGAAFVEIWLDGKRVLRTPAAAFIGTAGARLTRRPEGSP